MGRIFNAQDRMKMNSADNRKLVFVAKGYTQLTKVDEFGDESTSQVNHMGTYGSFGVFGMDGDPDCSV